MIRLATTTDAARILEIYAPFCEETTISFETQAPTVEEMASRIEKVLTRYPWLVWEVAGQVAGYAYASQHRERSAYRWAVDVAIYLDPRFRGQGGGRALYEELFRRLRKQGYFSAFAGIALPNEASIGLHRAVGFTSVGIYHEAGFKFGRWIDVEWYELALQPRPGNPSEPAPPASEPSDHSSR